MSLIDLYSLVVRLTNEKHPLVTDPLSTKELDSCRLTLSRYLKMSYGDLDLSIASLDLIEDHLIQCERPQDPWETLKLVRALAGYLTGVFVQHTTTRVESGPFLFGVWVIFDYSTHGKDLPKERKVAWEPGNLAINAWEMSEYGSRAHLARDVRRLQRRKPKKQ